MLLTSIELVYICDHCKHKSKEYVLDIGCGIHEIGTSCGIKSRLCPTCFCKMDIYRIKCDIEKSLFGNIDYGEWSCPVHKTIYDTSIMVHVSESEDPNKVQKGVMHKKVIDGGFPWKCPICFSRLEYYEVFYA